MSYQSVVEMSGNNSLLNRIAACAADEGQSEPLTWAQQNIWALCAAPGWDEAWDYARGTYTADFNPDTGARPSVVSDAMILSAVQALRTAQSGG